MNRTTIYNLENFGLKLNELQRKDYLLFVSAHFSYPSIKSYLNKSSEDRGKLLSKYLKKKLSSALSKASCEKHQVVGSEHRPNGFKGWVRAKGFLKLYRTGDCSSIFIEKIKGLKYREIKENQDSYFGVKAEYVIQIENQTKGLQNHEIRYLRVKAKSEADAKRKVATEAKEYGEPYLNDNMELVRWKLFDILDVEYITPGITKEVTEVYSELF